MTDELEIATFAGGCFWCTEAIFQRLNGVLTITPGYTGGNDTHPTYESVSSGASGHAEAIEISFNPEQITYQTLVEIFMATHDPCSLNQQGADVGSQYRSVIFYHSSEQKKIAENIVDQLNHSGKYSKPIVTAIESANEFYPAESYHLDYYNKNTSASYCRLVIDPKIKKLIKEHSSEVKSEYL